MAAKSDFQRSEQYQALLVQRRQVVENATKGNRARFAIE